jgi:hypothetical protein
MASNRIISKKELEDSGLSLRDYMNKMQGLTRKPDADVKFSKTSDKPRMETTGEPRFSTDYTGPRDKFGIPGGEGKGPSDPGKDTIDSSELGRNLSNAATALSGPLSSIGRIGRAASKVAEAAEAAPEVAVAAEKSAPVVKAVRVRVKKADGKTDVMDDINAGLKAAQKKLGPKGGGRDDILRADTMDENGLMMRRGGSVKKYAKGGAINLSNCKITTHTPSKNNSNW